MDKLKVLVYENGNFTNDEIDWIEKTEQTIKEYLKTRHNWDENDKEEFNFEEMTDFVGEPNEEIINGLNEILRLERGFDKIITIYQYFEKYDYLICLEYGEDTFFEWYACKDFKTLLAFLKELEPLLNFIEQEEALGHLEAIKEELKGILNPENYEWITNEKAILSRIVSQFKHTESIINDLEKKIKRKNFVLNDLCKEVIKASKSVKAK